jgi:hypothetical protein
MANFNQEIFNGKKFSDILEEIYINQKKKQKQVTSLIQELKHLINDVGDATLIVPLIKEYMDIGVKNDDALVRMATIIQRHLNSSSNNDDGLGITEEEKKQLLAEVDKLSKDNGSK